MPFYHLSCPPMCLLSLPPKTCGPPEQRDGDRVQGRVREKSQKQDQQDGEMEGDTVYTINVNNGQPRGSQTCTGRQGAQIGRNSWTKGPSDIGGRSSREEWGTQRGASGYLSPPKRRVGACLCLSQWALLFPCHHS